MSVFFHVPTAFKFGHETFEREEAIVVKTINCFVISGCSNTSNWLRVCRYCLENHLDKTKTTF